MSNQPSEEKLAAQSWQNVENWCRQTILQEGSGLGAVMIAYLDESGVGTVPYVHPDEDPREASLWLLSAYLQHIDESTPNGLHPLEIADHALALNEDYQDDPHIGWSTEKSVGGEPWEEGEQ